MLNPEVAIFGIIQNIELKISKEYLSEKKLILTERRGRTPSKTKNFRRQRKLRLEIGKEYFSGENGKKLLRNDSSK